MYPKEMDEIIEESVASRQNKKDKRRVEKITGLTMEELITNIRDNIQQTLREKAKHNDSPKSL